MAPFATRVGFLAEQSTGSDPEVRRRFWKYFEEITDRGW